MREELERAEEVGEMGVSSSLLGVLLPHKTPWRISPFPTFDATKAFGLGTNAAEPAIRARREVVRSFIMARSGCSV